ncbi:hypothetical protein BDV25DRAFT_67952 [Aspergillus avenaceus]|uniref:Uncharacterized protein n=1 Tax=Aspergillus avenaceus TaxID=36643 RepID=A0A5N6U1R3_ASPAV|nr:hypothetical protein BDV25DRAFT_67952 [Aspergillus avenaceus]
MTVFSALNEACHEAISNKNSQPNPPNLPTSSKRTSKPSYDPLFQHSQHQTLVPSTRRPETRCSWQYLKQQRSKRKHTSSNQPLGSRWRIQR